MQEREALLLMESNELIRLIVCRDANHTGWVIKLDTKSSPHSQHTLATKREKTQRIFKTSDAALRWCKKIGFNEVTVTL